MRRPSRLRPLLLSLATVLALAACRGDDEAPDLETPDGDTATEADDGGELGDGEELDDGEVDDGEATDAGGATDDDGTDGDAADDGQASEGVPPLDDEASTEDRIVGEEGFGLTLVDVRVGAHEGFDRVTFEVEGDAGLGYNVTVDEAAIQHGSGDEVDVEGDGVVTVSLRGMYLPPDRPAGVDAFEEERVGPPSGAGAVTEVVDSGIYEGHHLWFIGTRTPEVPVRVVRLEDPQRLVIDLVHH